MIKFKDVAHLYLGCEVLYENYIHIFCGISKPYKTNDKTIPTISVRPNENGFRSTIYSFEGFDKIKPILRPLSDMTEDECDEYNRLSETCYSVANKLWDQIRQESSITKFLLSKYFDLFSLIEAGLAIDKTKLR
jgi:hypothetical protein